MVTVYSIPDCPYCAELKQILTTEGLKFTEVDVSLPENETIYNKIHEVTKSDQVPIVKVGRQLLVPEVSFNSIRECVDITKKFLD